MNSTLQDNTDFFFGGGGWGLEGVALLASKVNYKQRGSGVLIIKSQQDSGSKFLPKRLNINLLTQIFN